jgi:SPP1 family predicted phage head-tail adaptor
MPVLFIDPGQLTARLDLETPVETSDGQGGVTVTWTVLASLWARIEPVSMERQELASQNRATITHRILMRARTDLSPARRLRKGSRLFEILSFQDPDETGRYLVCLCAEGRL